ncbi:MAG TPA: helix-turn-helix transcriptional regulator [Bacillota bacterium]|nr:helix-turn-helix transcriptional regulator [Bacillota bacterium]
MDHERIGRRIKAFRKLKGYTQIELAKALGVPISHLGEVERGTRVASGEFINKIAKKLDINREEIIWPKED